MTMSHSVQQQAQALLKRLASHCRSSDQGYGSMSASIYDTAWLSMLQKPRDSGIWLFPESFGYILKHQLDSGGWTCYASPVDGILNTASALLSLQRHLEADPQHQDWIVRSRKAQSALQRMLNHWDVSVCDQVGFEILVVNHLSLLHEAGLDFEFSQLGSLKAIRDAKLAKLPLDNIYQGPSTSCHSLEAFIGHIDFDRVSHWLDENGSMMGSPASTAAYLMHASVWDDTAELYLKNALNRGFVDGSVPYAWPTTIFEVSWATTTLLEAGISIEETEASEIARFLKKALDAQSGTVGFAPSILPDADDTARAILTLVYMGEDYSVDSLVKAFEGKDNFKTYEGERNASFGANCNVLICLLMFREPGVPKHASQIAKAARFLCDNAFYGLVKEKWCPVSLAVLCELMALSMFVYQADEFMESVVEKECGSNLPLVKTVVHRLCSNSNYSPESAVNGLITPGNQDLVNGHRVALEKVADLLGHFVSYFRHPAVLSSPAHLQARLAVELETFLLAHITHAEDNLRFQRQGDISSASTPSRPIPEPRAPADEGIPPPYRDPGRTFLNWVQSISADHTSCPVSFVFYSCLVKQAGVDIFSTPDYSTASKEDETHY